MLASELKQEPKQALMERLAKLREEIFKAKFKATTEPIDKPHLIREKRKDIARIETILRAEELKGKTRAPKLTREKRADVAHKKAHVAARKAHATRVAAERKRATEHHAKAHAKGTGKKPAPKK